MLAIYNIIEQQSLFDHFQHISLHVWAIELLEKW